MTQPAEELARLAREFWAGALAAHPVEATSIGEAGFDDKVDDISPEAVERERQRLLDVAGRARAIPVEPLDGEDRVTRDALIDETESEAAVLGEHLDDWTVDVVNGWPTAIQNVPSFQASDTPVRAAAMVERWRAFGGLIDQLTANLRRGLADGRVAAHTPVSRAIDALTTTLATPDEESALLEPLRKDLAPGTERGSAAQRAAFAEALTAAVRDRIKPAFARHRAFLADEVLPRARPDDRPGIAHLPGGEAAYRTLIRRHTTLDLAPEELHATGLAEVERINGEMATLGGRVLGVATRDGGTEPPAERSGDALLDPRRGARRPPEPRSIGRTRRCPRGSAGCPVAACVVVPMPAHEEEHSTIAYYRPPALDGSRPGQYYLNTSSPTSRPRYEAEASRSTSRSPATTSRSRSPRSSTGLPDFRRHLGADGVLGGLGPVHGAAVGRDGPVHRRPRPDRDAVDGRVAGVPARRRHGHARARLDAPGGDRLHARTAPSPRTTSPTRSTGTSSGRARRSRTRPASSRCSACAPRRRPARRPVRHPAFHDAVLGNGAISLGSLRGVIDAWIAAPAA